MQLKQLSLQNFRSHTTTSVSFEPGINLILGPNGSGKTNILEAIFILTCGKSFRSSSLSKLINWSGNVLTSLGTLSNGRQIEVQLIKEVNDNTTIKRRFLVDHVAKTRKAYIGSFRAVVFHPEDIRLVAGSPSRRRDFLDEIFTQSEWRYTSALSQYHRALKHRNELLDQIRLGVNQKSELFYWDQSLIKNAGIVHDHRLNFVRFVNQFLQNHPNSEVQTVSLNYHPSVLTQEKLEYSYSTDLARGYTQFGIHRDDFSFDNSIFPSADKNLANWGSRGQQRLAVLAIRLAQISYLENVYSEKPVLLLDDIFSELDPEHKALVVEICQKYQSIFTSPDPDSASNLPSANLVKL